MRWQSQYLGNMDKTPCFPAMSCCSCTELVSSQIWAHWERTIHSQFCRKVMVQKSPGADLLLQACTKSSHQKADM